MTKRWIGHVGLFCLVLTGCSAENTESNTSQSGAGSSGSTEIASAVQIDASPIGKWKVLEASLYGKPAPDQIGVEVDIHDDGTAAWPRYGQAETIEFILAEANPDGSVPFRTANSEDQFPNGGSGPRNGLLRILESGDMEIIEATSAGESVPVDFSEATQKTALFLRLQRV